MIQIDNYQGLLSWGHYSFDYWKSSNLPKLVQTGERPIDIVMLSTRYFHSQPWAFELGPAAKLTQIGNSWAENTVPDGGWQAAASALDHLRQLGAVDLQINHPTRKAQP